MRVWDRVEPARLCRQHLLGEHREVHGLWSVIVTGKPGYAAHPETRRWRGHERALQLRHRALADEMEARGYNHRSPLPLLPAPGSARAPEPIDDQLAALRAKGCACEVRP